MIYLASLFVRSFPAVLAIFSFDRCFVSREISILVELVIYRVQLLTIFAKRSVLDA